MSLMFLPVAPNDRFLGNILSEPSRMPKIFLPVPGCEIVGSAELRKGKHENKTGGNWGEQERRSPSPLSESLEQAKNFREPKNS